MQRVVFTNRSFGPGCSDKGVMEDQTEGTPQEREDPGPCCGSVSKSSYILGDPPPDPRFLASLGALLLAHLHHSLDWGGL
jgi:hypothetical protein